MSFWVISHLLYDDRLLANIKTEMSSAFRKETLDLNQLLERCPRLDSVYNEILRLKTGPVGSRNVESDVIVGGKTLRAGHRVLMPYRELHLNKEVFGENADEFDPDRFLNNKSLSRSPSYRPFGGAITYCPGRFLARREVYTFVALVFHRFDIGLAALDNRLSSPGEKLTRPPFPRTDVAKTTGGMLGPVVGDDVHVSIRVAVH